MLARSKEIRVQEIPGMSVPNPLAMLGSEIMNILAESPAMKFSNIAFRRRSRLVRVDTLILLLTFQKLP